MTSLGFQVLFLFPPSLFLSFMEIVCTGLCPRTCLLWWAGRFTSQLCEHAM